MYADRYNKMYKVLKEKYPDITFICTFGLNNRLDLLDKVDMIDPHWYVNPLYFYENDHLFDSVERGKYDIYVGEYAVNQGVGPGNLDAALAGAACISAFRRVVRTCFLLCSENVQQQCADLQSGDCHDREA